MPKIRNADLLPARMAIRAMLEYEHPVTRCGVMMSASMQLRALDDELKQRLTHYEEAFNALVRKYGSPPKEGGNPVVAKDAPERPQFNEEVAELNKTEVEIKNTIAAKDLTCRNEDGEREMIEPKGSAFFDLGDLLIMEPAKPAPKPKEKKR